MKLHILISCAIISLCQNVLAKDTNDFRITVLTPPANEIRVQSGTWPPLFTFANGFDKLLRNETHWSVETIRLRAGIFAQHPVTARTNVALFCAFRNDFPGRAEDVLDGVVFVPSVKYRFDMTLTDQSGTPVKKTREGRQLGSQLHKFVNAVELYRACGISYHFRLEGDAYVLAAPIVLSDYFDIKRAGTYHLNIEVRVAYETTNGVFSTLYLPVELDVTIDN